MKTQQIVVEAARRAYRCIRCNYGISIARLPVRCPMCGGGTWAQTRPHR
jgi:DNA-directed RNA polymerase subunit RPC12/RpoP